MQIQFLVVFCHTFQIQFQPNCEFSKFIGLLLSLNAALFTYMFSSFYIKSYNRKAKAAAAAEKKILEDEKKILEDEKKMLYDENSNELPKDGDKLIKAE